ncbi:NAD-dependent epimerase/dehydratase family protein [Ruminococcaceae bacterium OttesenSCG-928-I18]|nr:NAD-dependent epimerase/dehydratase family protein [Ruminococcaceae bacterium OttesenSCG-928-I18]
MQGTYIVTGASGHLGGTIVRELAGRGAKVRGLIQPGEQPETYDNTVYFTGDVRDIDSLRPLFEGAGTEQTYVIHTAGLVDIADKTTPLLYEVNVNGTKNIIELCRQYHVTRLLYTSSVHAIPEKDKVSVLQEVNVFSPDAVHGGYAKTKAEATQAVLDAAKQGLDAVVVQPSGILGPYDQKGNHLVQLVADYLCGRLPAGVRGGYDFVDVRDVAMGCLSTLECGRSGECYILSNRHYEVKELLYMLRQITGGRWLPVLPMWMAKAATPFIQWWARLKKRRPLYTRYSLYTLRSNDKFSHDKATAEFGYRPRDLFKTLCDTVAWMQKTAP